MSIIHNGAIDDLRRANATLQQQLDEYRARHDAALSREAALAEVLRVINQSQSDPLPAFEMILEKAHRLCDADGGTLAKFDGEYFQAVATHGRADRHAALVRLPFRPHRNLQPLVDGARFVHDPDIRVAASDDDVLRTSVDAGERSTLAVPLRKDGVLVGCVSAFRHEPRPFSENEITLLESLAAPAVIAMENARLLDELRQRTGDLEESLEY
jgi:GAF domain-containing protein